MFASFTNIYLTISFAFLIQTCQTWHCTYSCP